MNRYEREVFESLLNSEEEVLEELEKQYRSALNQILEKIKLFQSDIDMLNEAMTADGIDDATRTVLMSQARSRAYQKKFQEALYGQVSGILEQMHGRNYATIEEYLKQSYEDGYVGTLYDLAQQGVPDIILPINQAAATQAILTDSKVSEGLYSRLGVDVGRLKTSISQEITRGIATSMSYAEIARNINNRSMIGLHNAQRIARTEGHRIQNTASRDASLDARDHGADLVKVWDATLDQKTRISHRLVDGEVRELEEKFSNGLDRPGDPAGSAAEVINCRCQRIHKPRWAIEGGFVKMDNFTGELRAFETPEDYAKFKEWYWSKENLDYMDFVSRMESKYGTRDFTTLLGSMSESEYSKFTALESASPMWKTTSRKNTIANGKIQSYNSGAISGAYNNKNDPDGAKRDAHAEQYYASLRNSKKEPIVTAIAEHAQVPVEQVTKMFDHLIVNKYNLEKGYSHFDPDYDIAESLQRLREGKNIQAQDLILIGHESLEYDLMHDYGLSYEEAHVIANQSFNYQEALEKWLYDS